MVCAQVRKRIADLLTEISQVYQMGMLRWLRRECPEDARRLSDAEWNLELAAASWRPGNALLEARLAGAEDALRGLYREFLADYAAQKGA